MNAADVIGYVTRDGDYFCPCCNPDSDNRPIFGDSEADSFNHCSQCEELIPENLTSEGRAWLVEQAEDFLLKRSGRPEIHRQWAEHAGEWWAGEGDRGDLIIDLWRDAVMEENLKVAKLNMMRKVREILLAAEPCEECSNADCAAIRSAIREIES